ncbi:MAG: hypothetical protein FWG79_09375, partial [Bacteroidales bacterium]|nr:hypothetical protein [Bacteroidales bacterium]
MKRNHLLIAIALCLTTATTTISAQGFTSGNGTASSPWVITDRAQLELVNYYLGSLHANKHFRLGANINLGGSTQPWTPIGEPSNTDFYGNFDGAGFTISGLYINNSGANYQGLFRATEVSATIRNVGIVNANIVGASGVGALVAYNYGNIENCYSSGTVTGTGNVGGLIGHNGAGNISQSTITRCYSTATVTRTGTVGAAAVGGLVGYNYNARIEQCYAAGQVIGEGSPFGGLVGHNLNGTVRNSFYDKQVSGRDDTGKGTGKTTDEMKTASTFTNAGWDFQTHWWIVGNAVNNGYPVFHIFGKYILDLAEAPSNNEPLWTYNAAGDGAYSINGNVIITGSNAANRRCVIVQNGVNAVLHNATIIGNNYSIASLTLGNASTLTLSGNNTVTANGSTPSIFVSGTATTTLTGAGNLYTGSVNGSSATLIFDGDVVVFATSVQPIPTPRKGIFFVYGYPGYFYGDHVTVSADLTLPEGNDLIIRPNQTLSIAQGVSVCNQAIVRNYGTINHDKPGYGTWVTTGGCKLYNTIEDFIYVITAGTTANTYSAVFHTTAGGDEPVANATNVGSISTVVSAILTDASGRTELLACRIRFGNGTDVLDVGMTQQITISGTGGKDYVILSGKLQGEVGVSEFGPYALIRFSASSGMLVSTGELTNTGAGYTINFAGGADAELWVPTGKVQSSGNYAAIHSLSKGRIHISGDAEIIANNNSNEAGSGVIYLEADPPAFGTFDANARLEISGGRVANIYNSTDNINSIAIHSRLRDGKIKINGGTIEVVNPNANALWQWEKTTDIPPVIELSNSPTLKGNIRLAGANQLSVDTDFAPTQTYTLAFPDTVHTGVAVAGGAPYSPSFALANRLHVLEIQGNDLHIHQPSYIIDLAEINPPSTGIGWT